MKAKPSRRLRASRRVQTILLEASRTEFRGLVQRLTELDRVPATAGESGARDGYSSPASSTNRLLRLGAKRKAADLTISESRISRIKQDDASHSRQKDMPTASVAGNSRVDVSPIISHMTWKLPMLEAKLAQLRSIDGKLEENLRGDPSM